MRPARLGATTCAALLALGLAACSRPQPAPAASAAPARLDAGTARTAGTPAAAGTAKPGLCAHQVPSDQCTRCSPELAAVFKDLGDWCEPHGLPESHCRECNPGLTFTASPPGDWCREHAVPESMCTRCNPGLVAKFIQAGDYCREHGFPASVCPIHHPERVAAAGAEPPVFPAPGTVVRLASPKTAEDVGIRTVRVAPRRHSRTLEVVGRLEFNRNRLAQLAARGDALILDVRVDVGDDVKAGQPLATLTSAAIGATQAQHAAAEARLKAARSAVQREGGLVHKGVSPQKNLEAAEAELAAAEAEFNAAKAALGAAGAAPGSGGHYALAAPFAGSVVSRDAVAGRSATAGQVLLQVADLATLWALLDVPEADASILRPGQPVVLTLEGVRGAPRESTISRVAASVDAATRTVTARVELPNPDRALKAGTFVRARIQVSGEHDALLVPRDAIQRAEGQTLVFVQESPGLYTPVPVTVGGETGGLVEVLSGLKAGAQVVTTGAFLLKTEVLKDSIGAGCCEEGGGE